MNKAAFIFILFTSAIVASCGSTEDNVAAPTSSDTIVADLVAPVDEPNVSTEKRDLLTTLVGDYSLVGAEGFAGANTIYDYSLVDGQWEASGSSIVQGMREAYDLELSENDIRKLASAKIIVADDLSVSYSCDGINYFTTPFKENGMEYMLSKPASEFISAMPDTMDANSIFIDGNLYLYAQDEVPPAQIEPIDIMQVFADAALITCDTASSTFALTLFYAHCCDHSTYVFSK
jgi:hypothetical protein